MDLRPQIRLLCAGFRAKCDDSDDRDDESDNANTETVLRPPETIAANDTGDKVEKESAQSPANYENKLPIRGFKSLAAKYAWDLQQTTIWRKKNLVGKGGQRGATTGTRREDGKTRREKKDERSPASVTDYRTLPDSVTYYWTLPNPTTVYRILLTNYRTLVTDHRAL